MSRDPRYPHYRATIRALKRWRRADDVRLTIEPRLQDLEVDATVAVQGYEAYVPNLCSAPRVLLTVMLDMAVQMLRDRITRDLETQRWTVTNARDPFHDALDRARQAFNRALHDLEHRKDEECE